MKLVALCLLAVCCSVTANNMELQQRKLKEVLSQLREVTRILQHSNKTLSTPPENIEDCCCQSALTCFRDNLLELSGAERTQLKLHKSLRHNLTVSSLEFKGCNSKNNAQMCHACDSHPKASVQVFFNSLQTLIHRGLSRQWLMD